MTGLFSVSLLFHTALAEPVYRLDPVSDGAVLVAAAAVSLGERAFIPLHAPVTPNCSLTAQGLCSPSELHPLDARVVGRWNEEWGRVTDIALVGAFALPYSVIAVDSLRSRSHSPLGDLAVESAVALESFLVTNVVVITFKHAMQRPRPTQYTDAAPSETFGTLEHQLSFPSGHAAAVASATSTTALTFWLHHPDSPMRWVLAGGAVGLTALTAVGRVQAGKHFPSDVVTGALMGGAIGLAIPWMHRSNQDIQTSLNWTDQGAKVTLTGTFSDLAPRSLIR